MSVSQAMKRSEELIVLQKTIQAAYTVYTSIQVLVLYYTGSVQCVHFHSCACIVLYRQRTVCTLPFRYLYCTIQAAYSVYSSIQVLVSFHCYI